MNLKALVRCFEIENPKYRGGAIDSSISLLFKESNDPIFYKYLKNFESIFDEIIIKIRAIEESGRGKILEAIKEFEQKINDLLAELRNAEVPAQETGPFPMVQREDTAEKVYRFKIIVCGDSSVGKTSAVLRFTDRAFRKTYLPTLGVNISEKRFQHEKGVIEFMIWDIAGQSKFQITRKHFYSGARGQLLVFDLTRPDTLENIARWHHDIKIHLQENIYGLIMGNKKDLVDQRKITPKEISKLSDELGFEYFETSALTGENIDEAFFKLGEFLLKAVKSLKQK